MPEERTNLTLQSGHIGVKWGRTAKSEVLCLLMVEGFEGFTWMLAQMLMEFIFLDRKEEFLDASNGHEQSASGADSRFYLTYCWLKMPLAKQSSSHHFMSLVILPDRDNMLSGKQISVCGFDGKAKCPWFEATPQKDTVRICSKRMSRYWYAENIRWT